MTAALGFAVIPSLGATVLSQAHWSLLGRIQDENDDPSPLPHELALTSAVAPWKREVLDYWDLGAGGSALSSIRNAVSLLENSFDLKSEPQLESFLHGRFGLAPLLLQMRDKIRESFGPGPRIALEILVDPEFREEPELFLVIKFRGTADEAYALLDGFDRGWWSEWSRGLPDRVNVDVSCV